jgi:hypothetical protein
MCPGLEVSIPTDSEDVTQRVRGAIEPGMSLPAAHRARWAVCRAIEKESFDKTGLVSEVEALYQGAQYRLFRYRTYTDVRLVFAPEYVASGMFDWKSTMFPSAGRLRKIASTGKRGHG